MFPVHSNTNFETQQVLCLLKIFLKFWYSIERQVSSEAVKNSDWCTAPPTCPQTWCFRDNSKSMINRCPGHWSYWVWWHHFRRVDLHSYSVRLKSPNTVLGKTFWVVILANIWFSYIFDQFWNGHRAMVTLMFKSCSLKCNWFIHRKYYSTGKFLLEPVGLRIHLRSVTLRFLLIATEASYTNIWNILIIKEEL